MTKERATEAQIQRAIVQWFQLALHANVAWCAIPNGGYRRRTEARIMKGLGTVPGAPDLVLWYPPGKSLCLEVKRDDGRTSESQHWFHARLQWCGIPIEIVRTLDDAIEACKRHAVPTKGAPAGFDPNEKIEDLGAHFAHVHKLKIASP